MNQSIYRENRVFHVDDPHGDHGSWYFEVHGDGPRGPFTFRRFVYYFMALATIIILQGCAAMSPDLVSEGKVNVETVPSRQGHVSKVSVLASETGVRVTGQVHGLFHERGYIYGHVDIEVISPDGTMQWIEEFRYRNRGGKSRTTPFSLDIPVVVADGSTIRVIHHAAVISDNE